MLRKNHNFCELFMSNFDEIGYYLTKTSKTDQTL